MSRAGADTGGTFTDFVVEAGGQLLARKVPSTPSDPAAALLEAGDGLVFDSLAHSTTVATNALLTRSAPAAALLITAGFEDVLELGRQARPELYALHPVKPEPLIPAVLRFGVAERVGPDGAVEVALTDDEVARAVDAVLASGVASVAVCLLHAWLYPAHEKRLGAALRARGILVSLSSETAPLPGEYERASTTAIDAYVKPVMAPYLARLQSPPAVTVLSSAGGAISTAEAAARPSLTVLSGPAAGVAGACAIAATAGVADFLSFDMGGTSTDVALVEGGRAALHEEGTIAGLPIVVPMIAVHTVGAGGGSIARIDAGGALLVGPESAGSYPGPVCYGRGGERPTVTDADVVLGYIPSEGFASGRMTLDVDAAREAIRREVAEPLGLDVTEAAWGIERIVNANMANATRKVLAGHGADPRDLALIAYGGNGAVHAWAIAPELGIDTIVVPKAAPAFSALGVLVADYVVDVVKSYVTPLSQVDVERLRSMLHDLLQEARKELEPAGLPGGDIEQTLFVQMAYPGQNFDMSVPVPEALTIDEGSLLDLAERFHDQHHAERGFAFRNQQPVVRGVRIVGRGRTPKPERLAETGTVTTPSEARTGTRRAYFGSWVDAPVFDGTRLGAGIELAGPALIDEPFTVVVVPPGLTAKLDALGNYVLRPA